MGIRIAGFVISFVSGIVISWQLFFFFFQAEDGIRDLTVTGVQTCALPIYSDGVSIPERPIRKFAPIRGAIARPLPSRSMYASPMPTPTKPNSARSSGRGSDGGRESGGEGKRGDLGGRRIIKKKKKKKTPS